MSRSSVRLKNLSSAHGDSEAGVQCHGIISHGRLPVGVCRLKQRAHYTQFQAAGKDKIAEIYRDSIEAIVKATIARGQDRLDAEDLLALAQYRQEYRVSPQTHLRALRMVTCGVVEAVRRLFCSP